MIDAEYFRTHIVEQFEELGEATAEIHLHNGTMFKVREISAAEPGYVLLQAYPPDGVTDESKARRLYR